ncbi:MAG: short-chain dehydrogenase [Azospira oryzae]|jgi:2-keto-3-deoxy-L-fuconate dehydrogenase|nr:MAG: short-chain dehydrogenase [Azospira oryzae]
MNNSLFRLEKKTAVVTGGGSGIGRAVAELFASQGATVAIIELNQSAADDVAEGITAAGYNAEALACNVTLQNEMINVFNGIAERHEGIDILVNCAGIAHIGKLDTTSEQDFDKIYNVNVKGTYNSMLAAIAHMKKKQKGAILNLASIASSVGLPDRFAYSMSKGAVVTMTLSVARDYIKEGIRCNCISPARVHTPFVDGFLKANYPGQEEAMFDKLSKTQPIGRMAQPREIAQLALYLCSEEASFITGTDYPIDGGFIRLNN